MTKFVTVTAELHFDYAEFYFVPRGENFVGAEYHFVVNELYIVTAEFDSLALTIFLSLQPGRAQWSQVGSHGLKS